jgi:putative endonuclease
LTYYTGSTENLVHRFDQHNTGRGARYTRGRELELVYFETVTSRSAALKREFEIKGLSLEKKNELIEKFQLRMKDNSQDKEEKWNEKPQ